MIDHNRYFEVLIDYLYTDKTSDVADKCGVSNSRVLGMVQKALRMVRNHRKQQLLQRDVDIMRLQASYMKARMTYTLLGEINVTRKTYLNKLEG